ncbi:hypothetical protein JCM5350_005354 [Sporobolomyces pararoseus]
MSLQDLPPELFELVAEPLRTRDYLSLCLTSKRLLHLTRPLLYKTVRLTMSHRMWDESESRVPGAPRYRDRFIRNRFFKTFSKNRKLAESITSLEVISDPEKLNDTPRLSWIITLLKESVNLLHLSLERPRLGCETLTSELLDAIPATLVSLKIVNRPIDVMQLAQLVSRLPRIIELDFSHAEFVRLSPGTIINVSLPQSFRVLDLAVVEHSWLPFYASLIAKAPNLEKHTGAFCSTRFVLLLDLSRLTSLFLISMTGEKFLNQSSANERPRSMEEVTFKLRQLVEKAPNLRKLKVYLGYYCGSFDSSLPTISILHHLPPSLEELALVGYVSETLFFTTIDLLRYPISPVRSPNLLSLEVHEEYGEDRVRQLCGDRGIRFVAWDSRSRIEPWKNWKL